MSLKFKKSLFVVLPLVKKIIILFFAVLSLSVYAYAGSVVVAHFNEGADPLTIDPQGSVGSTDQAVATGTYVAHSEQEPAHGNTGYSLKIEHLTTGDAWMMIGFDNTFVNVFSTANPTGEYKALSFWIRGAAGGETFEINLRASGGIEPIRRPYIKYFLPAGITTSWQKVVIPVDTLTKFFTPTNLQQIDGVVFNFRSACPVETIYIDDITFHTAVAPVYVDSFETNSGYNAWENAHGEYVEGGPSSGTVTRAISNTQFFSGAYSLEVVWSTGSIDGVSDYASLMEALIGREWGAPVSGVDVSACDTISCEVKAAADGDGKIIGLGLTADPGAAEEEKVALSTITLSTSWQTFSRTFSADLPSISSTNVCDFALWICQSDPAKGGLFKNIDGFTFYVDNMYFKDTSSPTAPTNFQDDGNPVAPGQAFSQTNVLTVNADAIGTDVTLESVRFEHDGMTSGATWYIIGVDTDTSDTSYTATWDVSGVPFGITYRVRVVAADIAGNEEYLTYTGCTVNDTTIPAAISDLTALTGANEGEINLQWTSPGDDENSVALTGIFRIKYSTVAIINSADFDTPPLNYAVTTVEISTTSLVPLTSCTTTFYSLLPGVTYWFAIRTQDASNNWSVWNSSADSPVGGQNTEASAEAFTLPVSSSVMTEVIAASSTTIIISFEDRSTNEDDFHIFRDINPFPTADVYQANTSSKEGVAYSRSYIFGGQDGGNISEIVEYDAATDTRVTKSVTLPTARYATSAAYNPANGKIYIFGGWDSGNISEIVEYDAATDTRVTKSATLPTGRSYTSAAYNHANGKIYIFGGTDPGYVSQIVEYDPATDSIVTKSATLPTARRGTSAAYNPANGKIYIFGGTEPGYVSQIVEYDPATDTSVIKSATLPTARGYTSAAYNPANGKIYIFGGIDGGYVSQIVEYDPAADTQVTKSATLPTGRTYTSAAYNPANGKFYIFGGQDGGGSLSQIVEYDPAADTQVTKSATLPTGRTYTSAGRFPGKSVLMSNLTPNTKYYFRVKAHNNTSDVYSEEYSNELSTYTCAATPINSSFTVVNITSATMTWDANNNPGGTEYIVQLSTDSAFSVFTASDTLTNFTTTFCNLSEYTTYYARVQARNNDGLLSAFDTTISTETLDGTSPTGISDLTALAGTNEGEINLQWTSPGDDENTGDLTGTFRIKYSTVAIINSTDFDTPPDYYAVTTVDISTTALPPLTACTTTLYNLVLNTTYYFAIKTCDEVPNWSVWNSSADVLSINNEASAEAGPPPIIQPLSDLSALVGDFVGAVKLEWTYPETLPSGSSFYVQCSTNPTEAWDVLNAQVVISTEVGSGQSEAVNVGGLDIGRDGAGAIASPDYYFRVWLGTAEASFSALSNEASGYANTPAAGTDSGPTAQDDGGWKTTFNDSGNSGDKGYGVAKDYSGNVFITGYVTNGANWDIIVRKYNSSGAVQWTKYYNSPNNGEDKGSGITADSLGNVYVTGYEYRSDLGQGYNVWVSKYDTSGIMQWTTTYNSPNNGEDIGNSIAVDGSGNLCVTGKENRTDLGQGNNIWVGKYTTSGLMQWTTSHNGLNNNYDEGNGIAMDNSANIYVTGIEQRGDISQDYNLWICKYDTDGIIQWTSTYNDPDNSADYGYGITVDGSGNVYVTGKENRSGISQGYNIWVSKYDTTGLLQWTTTYNSPASTDDYGYSIAVDDFGNVYAAGMENRLADLGQGFNIWVSKYNSNGLVQWTTTYNSQNNLGDEGFGITVDGSGNVYVAGYENITGQSFNILLRKYVQTYMEQPQIVDVQRTANTVTLGWNDLTYESSYTVKRAIDDYVITALEANTTTYEATGFEANTSTTLYIEAYNSWTTSASVSVTTYTLANQPISLSFDNVYSSSITFSWDVNGNPNWTRFGISRSTETEFSGPGVSTFVVFSDNLTANTTTAVGLNSNTMYYFRLWAFNEDQIETVYMQDNTATAMEPTPGQITGLAAYQSGDPNQVKLNWVTPGDDDDIGTLPVGSEYRIQFSSDLASVIWSTASAQVVISTDGVAPGVDVSTQVAPPSNEEYYFKVWAKDENDNNWSPLSASATAYNSPFSFETVVSAGNVGYDCSLAVDRNSDLHVSYRNASSNDLRYIKRTGGSWGGDVSVASLGSFYTSIALDANGNPHIAYEGDNGGNLNYVKYNGATWDGPVSIETDGTIGANTSLAIDGAGNPHISYKDSTNNYLKYVKYDGVAWSTYTVDSGASVGLYTSIALDGAGNPQISYYDNTNFKLKIATYTGTAWFISTVDSDVDLGQYSSIAIDGNGNPHISYYDFNYGKLKYAEYDGTKWSTATVDDRGSAGGEEHNSITLDGNGYPHIAYYDGVKKDLKYARYDGVAWSTATVDSEGDVGYYYSPTISFDGSGDIHIIYLDNTPTNVDLKAAHWTGAGFGVSMGGNARGKVQSPANFSGVVQSSTAIQWNWSNNSINADGYRIYSSSAGNNFILAADTITLAGNGVNSCTTSNLTPNTSYQMYAAAVNAGGVVTSSSAVVWTLAAAPVNISFDDVGSSSITFSWTDNNPDYTRYGISRSTEAEFSGPGVSTFVIFTDNLTVNTTTVIGLNSDTQYYFRVWAFNEDQLESPYTQSSVTTVQTPPAPIDNLTALTGDYAGAVKLEWTYPDTLPSGSSFYVQCSTDPNISWDVLNAQVVSSTEVGSGQSAVVNVGGLDIGRDGAGAIASPDYYFRVWLGTEAALFSALSNSASSYANTPSAGTDTGPTAQDDGGWMATFNGSGNTPENGIEIASDNSGNSYVMGDYNGDIFVKKYNSAGTIQWTKYYNSPANGSDGGGGCGGIAVDVSGNIYVTNSEVRAELGQGSNVWVRKYDNSNPPNVLWTQTYNGPVASNSADAGEEIEIDNSGNVYIVGVQQGTSGQPDILLMKYNTDGLLQWTTSYNSPGNNEDYGIGLCSDASGNPIITGWVYNAGYNIPIRKYSADGTSLLWSLEYNSGQDEVGYGIDMDGSGNLYIAGHQNASGQGENIWVRKYDTGAPPTDIWTKTYNNSGTNGNEESRRLYVDSYGNAYITGYENVTGQGTNIWVRKYDTNGLVQWTTTYNSPNNSTDEGAGISVDGSGNVYVTGYENRSDLVQGNDLWVRKYVQSYMEQPQIVDVQRTSNTVTLGWNDLTYESSYTVKRAIDDYVFTALEANTTTYEATGFEANTSTTLYIEAYNSWVTSASVSVTTYTLANPPLNLSIDGVYSSSVTMSWDVNSNPNWTRFGVSLSTNSDFVTAVSTVAAFTDNLTINSFFAYGLNSDTTYYFHVWAFNEDQVETTYIEGSTTTLTETNLPANISDLTALTGGTSGEIVLQWTSPGDDDTVGNLTGEFEIKYSTVAQITAANYTSPPDPTYTINIATDTLAPLTSCTTTLYNIPIGAEYWFAIKAKDDNNNWSVWNSSADVLTVNTSAYINIPEVVNTVTSGNWSSPSTWADGMVPWASQRVGIQHTVTFDRNDTSVTCSTITIYSAVALQFDGEVADRTMIVGGGIDIQNGAQFLMPPNTGYTSALKIQCDNYPGEFGITVNNGGVFDVQGSSNTTPSTRNCRIESVNASSQTYIRNLSSIEANFNMYYIEVSSVGADTTGKRGITFDGAGTMGKINYCSIHNGYYGIYLNNSSSNTITNNSCYLNYYSGIEIDNGSNNNTLNNNVFYSNSFDGITLDNSHNNIVSNNSCYSNTVSGIYVFSSSSNTITNNSCYSNTNYGIFLYTDSSNNTLGNNSCYSNSYGIYLANNSGNNIIANNLCYSNSANSIYLGSSSNNTLSNNNCYSSSYGIYTHTSMNNTAVNCEFGTGGNDNTNGDIGYANGFISQLTLKNCNLYSPTEVNPVNINASGSYLVSYNQDGSSGTVKIRGDYQILNGQTDYLNYGQVLYVSTATLPISTLKGSGSITYPTTSDEKTLTELWEIKYNGSSFDVKRGTWSAMTMDGIANIDSPYSSADTGVGFTVSGTPQLDDAFYFVTLASSTDNNVQKQIEFNDSPVGTRMFVNAGGSLQMLGDQSYPTISTSAANGVYYGFLSSGSLNLSNYVFSNLKSPGLEIFADATVVDLSSGTFDNVQSAANSRYIWTNSLTSFATFYNCVFNDISAAAVYNIYTVGSGTEWTFINASGVRSGENFDYDDAGSTITWAENIPPAVANYQGGGDNNIRTSSGTLYDVDFFDDGGLDNIQYKVCSDIAQINLLVDWTNFAVLGGATYYQTDWVFTEGDFNSISSLPTTNYVSVRAWDVSGNGIISDNVFYVLVDTGLPTSVVTYPIDANLETLSTISGTANDNYGLNKVEIEIKRLSDDQYWTGVAWGSEQWLSASASDGSFDSTSENWQYTGLTDGALTPGTSYWVVARASDTVGNIGSLSAAVTFTYKLKKTIGTGNWDTAGVWLGGQTPLDGDVVYIEPGHSVTLTDDTSSLYSLTVDDGATINNQNSYAINITSGNIGGFYNYGTLLNNVAGTLSMQGNKVILSTDTTRPLCGSLFVLAGGTVTLTPNMPIMVRGVNIAAGGALDANDTDITVSSFGWTQNGTFLPGGGSCTVSFMSESDQNIGGNAPITFANLDINSSSNVIAAASLDINGNFTIYGGTFAAGNFEHFISSSFIQQPGGGFEALGSTLSFKGDTNENITLQLGTILYCLNIAKTGASLSANSNLDINGNFTIDASTFQPGSWTHNLGGSFIMQNNGTFGSGSGTFVFDGPGTPQYIPSGGNWNRFGVEPGATVVGSGVLTAQFMNDFVVHEGAVFDATNGTPEFNGGTFSSSGAFITANSTVTFDGNVQITAAPAFNGLKIGDSSAGFKVYVSTEFTAAGLTISSGTLELAGSSATVFGPTTIIGQNANLDINLSSVTLLGSVDVTNGGSLALSNTSPDLQSKLTLGNQSVVDVSNGGFLVSYSSGNVITSDDPGTMFYSFNVFGATVNVTGMTLKSMDSSGLEIDGAEIVNFDNVNYEILQPGATALNLVYTVIPGTWTFTNHNFDSTVSSNVAAVGLTSGIILMNAAAGANAGPDYENDPNDRIYWDGSDTITLVEPNGGETFTVGDSTAIIWNTAGSVKNVLLEYSNDDFISDVNYIATVSTSATFGTYGWAVPNSASPTTKVRVSAANYQVICGTSPANFTILPAPITAISSLVADIDSYAGAVKLTWTYPEALPSGSSFYVQCSTNPNENWDVLNAKIVQSTNVSAGDSALVSVGGLDIGRDGANTIISPDYHFRVWLGTAADSFSSLSNPASSYANTPAVGTDTGPDAQPDGGWMRTFNNANNNNDSGKSVATDTSGNVYIVGTVNSGIIITRKYNPAGAIQWTKYHNSPDNSPAEGKGVAVDGSGNVYVAGYEARNDAGEGNNIWITKYNTNGVLQWTETYNNPNNTADIGSGIAVDGSGNVYVTGSEYRTDLVQDNNVWVSKYDTDGLLQWTTTYNSPNDSDDRGNGIAVDGTGNVYVAGIESRTDLNQNYNIWVRKYDNSTPPLVLWTTTYNSPSDSTDFANGIAVDAPGNVYVVGYESRNDLVQGYNIWTAKYDTNGLLQWTSTYSSPGNSGDYGYGIDVDGSGVYVTGYEDRSAVGQSNNIWAIKYDGSTGLAIWTTTYNDLGNFEDKGNGITVDDSGNVYLIGSEVVAGQAENLWLSKYNQSNLTPPSIWSMAKGISQITFEWTDSNYESSYTVRIAADNYLLAELPANTLNYAVTGMGVNESTGIYITAYNSYSSSFTAPTTAYTLANPPTSSVIVNRSSFSVEVDWFENSNPGYTRYSLLRSDDGFTIGTTTILGLNDNFTSTIFVDTTVAENTQYWYKVQAFNQDDIETGFDVAVNTVTLPAPPEVPSNLTFTLLGQTSIQWQFYDNATNEDALYISSGDYVRLSENLGPLSGTGTTSWLEVNIGTNTLVTRYAEAWNTLGSVYSAAAVSSYTLASVPDAFVPLTYSPNSIQLNWGANDNPGSTIYGISCSSDPAFTVAVSTFAEFASGLTATTTIAYNLEFNTEYYFRLWAYNGDGIETYYVTDSTLTSAAPLTPPDQISDLSGLTGDLDGEVILSWTAPGEDGTVGNITNGEFTIKFSTNAMADDSAFSASPYSINMPTDTVPLAPYSFVVTGLNPGTEYYFALEYKDGAGNWANWAADTYVNTASTAIARDLVPPSVTDLTGAGSDTQITLNWTVPDAPFGELNDYQKFWIYRATASFTESEKNNDYYVTILATYTYEVMASTSYLDAGLENNLTYYYHISLVDAGDGEPGSGMFSVAYESFSVVEFSTCAWEPMPGVPSGFTGAAMSTSSIQWSWADVSGEDNYFVLYSTDPQGSPASPEIAAGVLTWTETDLLANTSYYRAVVATNTAGISGISNEPIICTLAAPPVSPVGFSEVGYSSAVVTWNGSPDNPSWTRYGVMVSVDASFATGVSTIVAFTDDHTIVSTTAVSLVPETTYYFRIIAFNEAQFQTEYIQDSTMTTVGPPLPPSNLKISVLLGQTSIYWQVDDNSTNEDELYISSGADTSMRLSGNLADTAFTGTTYWAEEGLSPNTTYTRYAEVLNVIDSVWSVPLTSATASAMPSGGVLLSRTSYSADIDWLSNGNPEPGTEYVVSCSTAPDFSGEASAVASDTIYTMTGLLPSSTYYFRVRAMNLDQVINQEYEVGIETYTLPAPATQLQVVLPGEINTGGVGISGTPTVRTAGNVFTVTVNAVNANYYVDITTETEVSITTSDTYISNPAPQMLVNGTVTFNITPVVAQVINITASTAGGLSSGISSNVTVVANTATRLLILVPGESLSAGSAEGKTGAPAAQTSYTSFGITVNACDDYWNVDTAAAPTVAVNTTDPADTNPPSTALVSGTKLFTVTPVTVGTSSMTVIDFGAVLASYASSYVNVMDEGTPPAVVIEYPANSAYYNALLTISGTASDNVSVSSVSVSIGISGGNYWDGSGFNSAAQNWRACTVYTSSWTYPAGADSIPAWADGITYIIEAKGMDAANNWTTAYATNTFTFDLSLPASLVTYPVGSAIYSVLNTISGTAADSLSGVSAGVAEVAYYDVTNAKYWTGSNWTGTSHSWITATLTAPVWTSTNVPTWTSDTDYAVYSRATDNVGNIQVAYSTVTFRITSSMPTAPSGLTATEITASSIKWLWTDNASNEEGYRINSSTAIIQSLAAGTAQYSQSGLDANTAYSMYVEAYNAAGVSTSAIVSKYTLSNIPATFVVASKDYNFVSLQWSANGNPSGTIYKLQSSTDNVVFTTLISSSDATTYIDGNLEQVTTYYYRIYSVNGDSVQTGPAELSVTTLNSVIKGPISGSVTQSDGSAITGVLVELYSNDGTVKITEATTNTEGKYEFTNLDDGVYRLVCSWVVDEMESMVYLTDIPENSKDVRFTLEIQYTLAMLSGRITLGSRANLVGRFAPQQQPYVELIQRGRVIAKIDSDTTGTYNIPNLLPGKYVMQAFNGVQMSEPTEVYVREGEQLKVNFVWALALSDQEVYAYPNPWKPGQNFPVIRYSVPNSNHTATIKIYNIAGELVREVKSNEIAETAPVYKFTWNLRNDDNDEVASGVYIYILKLTEMTTGEEATVKKKLAIIK